jgi:hypothetical protein
MPKVTKKDVEGCTVHKNRLQGTPRSRSNVLWQGKSKHWFQPKQIKTRECHTVALPSIYEGRLFVLFCSYEIHRTGMFQMVFLVSLESSRRGAVHGLGSTTFGLAGQKFFEYWTISSLKIKLNLSWQVHRNWNVPLVLLERSWWAGFNGIKIWIQNVGDIDF